MILYPNCKINIGLHIVGKRADGYHNLETLFYPVYALHDELEICPADTFSFEQEGIAVDCPVDDNLIIKCYHRMRNRYPQIGNVSIRFRKNIPFGAGLGGGSSDAAHTAIALNQLFGLGLSTEALAQEVLPLGADCPYFIYNTPCYAEGIGDRLTPVDFSLSGMQLLLYKPACHVSTKEAYAGIAIREYVRGHILQSIRSKKPLSEIKDSLTNDFEQTVFAKHPEIGELKQRLIAEGAIYASMSGSGSAVFALFDTNTDFNGTIGQYQPIMQCVIRDEGNINYHIIRH